MTDLFLLNPLFVLAIVAFLAIFFQSLLFYLKYRQKKKKIVKVKLWSVKILSGIIMFFNLYYAFFYKECLDLPQSFGLLVTVSLLIFLPALIIIHCRHTLGINYSTELELHDRHQYIKHGFYKWFNHPIYFSEFLIAIGAYFIISHPTKYIFFIVILFELVLKTKAEALFLKKYFPIEYLTQLERIKGFLRLHSKKRRFVETSGK